MGRLPRAVLAVGVKLARAALVQVDGDRHVPPSGHRVFELGAQALLLLSHPGMELRPVLQVQVNEDLDRRGEVGARLTKAAVPVFAKPRSV